jgi:hypothetical protein
MAALVTLAVRSGCAVGYPNIEISATSANAAIHATSELSLKNSFSGAGRGIIPMAAGGLNFLLSRKVANRKTCESRRGRHYGSGRAQIGTSLSELPSIISNFLIEKRDTNAAVASSFTAKASSTVHGALRAGGSCLRVARLARGKRA